MKPSSLSTWARLIFRRVAGMSTNCRSMRLALRMRVSMSARGSVIMVGCPSPAGLHDAGDQSIAGHVAEADAADAELPVHGPRPAAQPATQPDADDLTRQHHLGLVLLAALVRGGLDLAHVPVEGDHVVLETNPFRFDCHIVSLVRGVIHP